MKKKNPLASTLVWLSLLPVLLMSCLFIFIYSLRINYLISQNLDTAMQLQQGNVISFWKRSGDALAILTELTEPQKILYTVTEKRRISQPEGTQDSLASVADKGQSLGYDSEIAKAREVLKGWIIHQPALNRVSIVDMSNRVVVSSNISAEGGKAQLEDRYLTKLSEKQPVVTRLFEDALADNVPSFIIARPIIVNDSCLGYIMLSVKSVAMQNIFDDVHYFKSGEITLLDVGNCVVASNSAAYKAGDFKQVQFNREINGRVEPMGQFKYRQDGKRLMVNYFRFEQNGWTLICTVSPSEFSIPLWQLIAFLIVVCFTFWGFTKLMQRAVAIRFTMPLSGLLNSLGKMENGNYADRIPFLGNNEFSEIGTSFNKLLTRIEQDNKELCIKEERYRIANEQSNSVIFEYNVETAVLTCSPNACEFAEYPNFIHNFPDSIAELNVLHSDEAQQFMRLFKAMISGRRQGAMEVRVRTYRDEYHWFSLLLTTIIDNTTFKPLRVIGKLTDIDEEKKITANLTFKSERDPLTSIYNKSTTQAVISRVLAQRRQDLYYGCIVMDIDNFKGVNDNFGHQKGDAVLNEVAIRLKGQLHSEDVLGRIGGDEFMMLLTAMPSREAIAEKAESLLCEMRLIMLDERAKVHVTCSMGIALCPNDGTGFNQLYASADNALYVRKKAGKDGYSFYKCESSS